MNNWTWLMVCLDDDEYDKFKNLADSLNLSERQLVKQALRLYQYLEHENKDLKDENRKLRLAMFDLANSYHTGTMATVRAMSDIKEAFQEYNIKFIPQHELEAE